ncbi:MAG: hypothetical protein HeimC2_34800 [Candidatus Heimdallarchaeota archaeon LC_2]|nr:MAG: hypothetical protein HeimC2_34800 [Candidatus Heimdallarchaeota archaeon LC_2]
MFQIWIFFTWLFVTTGVTNKLVTNLPNGIKWHNEAFRTLNTYSEKIPSSVKRYLLINSLYLSLLVIFTIYFLFYEIFTGLLNLEVTELIGEVLLFIGFSILLFFAIKFANPIISFVFVLLLHSFFSLVLPFNLYDMLNDGSAEFVGSDGEYNPNKLSELRGYSIIYWLGILIILMESSFMNIDSKEFFKTSIRSTKLYKKIFYAYMLSFLILWCVMSRLM